MSAAVRMAVAIDDFGLHAGVRHAVLSLLDLNRVQAIGCMVAGRDWAAGCHVLRDLPRNQAEIGLHLDLIDTTCGAMPRHSLPGLIALSLSGLLNSTLIHAEIGLQLDRFEQAMGRAPDFVDGHRHVHQLQGVRQPLLQALEQRYGSRLPWVRCTRRPRLERVNEQASGDDPGTEKIPLPQFKPAVIESLGGAAMATLMRARSVRHNRRLLGVYDFRGGASRYERLLAEWVRGAQDGDLLMTHPSSAHQQAQHDPLATARLAEADVLGGSGFGEMLQRWGIELAPMSQILAQPSTVPARF